MVFFFFLKKPRFECICNCMNFFPLFPTTMYRLNPYDSNLFNLGTHLSRQKCVQLCCVYKRVGTPIFGVQRLHLIVSLVSISSTLHQKCELNRISSLAVWSMFQRSDSKSCSTTPVKYYKIIRRQNGVKCSNTSLITFQT